LFVQTLTTGFTWYYEWDKAGVMILGEVETGKFAVKWPISWSMITDPKFNFRSVLSSAMVVAILGFFETMVGVKHLAIVENKVSKANRELVALGAVNGVVCTSPPTAYPLFSRDYCV
jgi:MFS superfamily sulfate permease-like transporter